MLGDEGLSRWSKFDMGADARKIPKDVFAKFKESLGKDISFRTARATLYSSFRQQKGETAAELDLRLSKLVDECKFPTDPTNVKDFLKRDIYINALNYYEVKKWAAKEQEADLTYTKVMDKCKESMKQQLEIMWQWQMTILNSKQPINKVQQVWTTTHSKSRSSQAEAEETEATLVQESADLRTSQMEQNARDVDLSVIQLQMDPVQPSSQHVDSAR